MAGAAWKAYAWEQATWPEYRKIVVTRMEQEKYAKKLVRHFKTPPVDIKQSYRRGGAGCYHPKLDRVFKPMTREQIGKPTLAGGVIKMGRVGNLGTLIHEFAHHLEYYKYGKGGHRKTFKRCLKRVYKWSKRWLPKESSHGEVGQVTTGAEMPEARVLVEV